MKSILRSSRTAFEPNWIELSQRRPAGVAQATFAWLKDRGSLTRAVIAACNGRFRVEVVGQGWGRPLPGEAHLLGSAGGAIALVREVRLHCDDRAWVYARTLIPATSLNGRARRLAYLGNRPLGAVLFADPATRRRRIQIARLHPRHALFAPAVAHLDSQPDELWGRRTLFEYAGKPILVNEFFLPDIPARLQGGCC